MIRIAPALFAVALVAAPALAQTADHQTADQPNPPPVPVPATQAQPNPDGALSVAQVRLTHGKRVGKLIGTTVYAQDDAKIGTIDDVVLDESDKASLAILQVGGFLGVGGKLVAVPFGNLKTDTDGKVRLPDASKESLGAMPAFTYANG